MKKITYFTIQFRLKKLIHFRNLNSFEIKNNMLPKHSQKTFSVYKFSSKHVSICCQKKNLHALFPDVQELLSRRTLKENVYIFLHISLRKVLFRRRSKILSGGMWGGGKLKNFLRRLAVWAL